MCEIYHADYKEKDACQLAQHLSLSDIDISTLNEKLKPN